VVSTSDRRSGSLGPSKKRKAVYISTASHGRAAASAEKKASPRADGRKASPRADGRARVPVAHPSASRARADERKAQRNARLSSQRRARSLRTGALVAAVLVVFASCIALYNSALFTVRTVEVVGVKHITADAVRRLAQVPANATLIRFPADAVASRVEADPWVESVTVSRIFPSGMRIRVVERVPLAVVDAGASKWIIDRIGSVIDTASADASATLPTITDVPALDLKPGRKTISEPLLNAISVLTGVSQQLSSIVRTVSAPTIDGTALVTADHVEIVIGQATDLAKKDALARRILKEQRGKVVSIDVRVVDRPTWRGLK
jgi:cell division protein FtsQ